MRFLDYSTFLNESRYDAEAVLSAAAAVVNKMGYKILKEDVPEGGRAYTRFEFEGDGGLWSFECFNSNTKNLEMKEKELECYVGYPAKDDFTLLKIVPEEFPFILENVKKDQIPLHVINEFVEIMGFRPAKRIVQSKVTTKRVAASVAPNGRLFRFTPTLDFPKDINDRLAKCEMHTTAEGNHILTLDGDFPWGSGGGIVHHKIYNDFETDNFLTIFMELLDIKNEVARKIIEKTKDEIIGTCIPALRHALRGKITAQKFGF